MCAASWVQYQAMAVTMSPVTVPVSGLAFLLAAMATGLPSSGSR